MVVVSNNDIFFYVFVHLPYHTMIILRDQKFQLILIHMKIGVLAPNMCYANLHLFEYKNKHTAHSAKKNILGFSCMEYIIISCDPKMHSWVQAPTRAFLDHKK